LPTMPMIPHMVLGYFYVDGVGAAAA